MEKIKITKKKKKKAFPLWLSGYLDLDQLEPIDLSQCFIEFYERSEQCKFRGCLHENEPRCAVKSAVEAGEIIPTRYENYLQFLTEIKTRKPKY